VTFAGLPLVNVAVNWTKELREPPPVLTALQPVQLVSIEAVAGVIEKTVFEEFAVPSPPPQPASTSSAGARSIEKFPGNSRMVKVSTYILSTTSHWFSGKKEAGSL
jgi:hypothetical protein